MMFPSYSSFGHACTSVCSLHLRISQQSVLFILSSVVGTMCKSKSSFLLRLRFWSAYPSLILCNYRTCIVSRCRVLRGFPELFGAQSLLIICVSYLRMALGRSTQLLHTLRVYGVSGRAVLQCLSSTWLINLVFTYTP